MKKEKRTCETCRYHAEGKIEGYVCVCVRSRFCGENMQNNDLCKEWKGVRNDKSGS